MCILYFHISAVICASLDASSISPQSVRFRAAGNFAVFTTASKSL